MKFSLKKKSEEEGADVVSTPTKVKAVKTNASSPASTADGSVEASPTKSKFGSLFKMTSKSGNKDATATAGGNVSSATSNDIPVAGLEIRVGRISNVAEHEKEKHEKVYCMDVDIGDAEGGPRRIAAGLRGVMSADELNGRTVLVLCNVKSKKLGNYYSHGAVLCAGSSDTAVKLIAVPVDAKVGERVIVPGFGGPFDEVMSEKEAEKLKVVEKVMPHFKTNQFGVPEICNRPLMTTAGVCTCAVRNTAVTQI